MTTKKETFDVVVLGAGPGGYPAAIKLAQGGKKVALVEANLFGGTCLNRGCIPTKTLIAGAEVLQTVRKAEKFGIHTGTVSFEYQKMVDRKDTVVGKIRSGLQQLIKSNKITAIEGFGEIVSPNEVKVRGKENYSIECKEIIIATGSEPKNIPAFPFDYEKIHSSTSILEITQLPKTLVIIGAGYIGCEFASIFSELGVQVIILEALHSIIPNEAAAMAKALHDAFTEKNIDIRTGVKVQSIDTKKKGIVVHLEGGDTISADMSLVSVGRTINTDKIGLDRVAIATDRMGFIPVNDKLQTSVPNIYAIGDVSGKALLAHVASYQGLIAAEHILGHDVKARYHSVPAVIFTDPEIASVGMTLEQAIEKGYSAITGQFPFNALGKSQAADHSEGFAQIVIDEKTGQILGAQVVGYEAGTLIAQMATAIANELTVECIAETIHAHPTIAEAWMEAAHGALGSPVHLPPKRQRKPRAGAVK
ncbi:MAG: dihydrolipoyl dehydrogenase [Waddliaceae bacterium]|nr:dihydrolipoyl dehydrogenase [Waddliaceae bacterium]